MQRLIITTNTELVDFCQRCKQESYISIDTEFMRESTYYPRLCLVQIGINQSAAVIDPLAEGINLSPLYALLVDPKVIKVFHAARQDLEIFYHLMGDVVSPLFDTQIAAMAISTNEQISYQALVQEYLNLELDKGSRMTQWEVRPLNDAQLNYAFLDVEPLYSLYPLLLKKLADRQQWIGELHTKLTDPATLAVSPDIAWQLLKLRHMKPKNMGAVKAIAAWREETAMQLNTPRRWVMSDESVVAVALSLPKNAEECQKIRLKPKKIQNLPALLKAIQQSKPCERPQRNSRPEVNEDLLQLLRLALHRCARKNNVAARLMCSAEELQDLSGLSPRSSAWQQHPLQQGWRRELFGQTAEAIAQGELVLRYYDKQLNFMPTNEL